VSSLLSFAASFVSSVFASDNTGLRAVDCPVVSGPQLSEGSASSKRACRKVASCLCEEFLTK